MKDNTKAQIDHYIGLLESIPAKYLLSWQEAHSTETDPDDSTASYFPVLKDVRITHVTVCWRVAEEKIKKIRRKKLILLCLFCIFAILSGSTIGKYNIKLLYSVFAYVASFVGLIYVLEKHRNEEIAQQALISSYKEVLDALERDIMLVPKLGQDEASLFEYLVSRAELVVKYEIELPKSRFDHGVAMSDVLVTNEMLNLCRDDFNLLWSKVLMFGVYEKPYTKKNEIFEEATRRIKAKPLSGWKS